MLKSRNLILLSIIYFSNSCILELKSGFLAEN